MLVSELLSYLLDRFPREDAEAWDHVGLSVGDPDAEVKGVACALDATVDAIFRTAELGANVLLTHHPVYISAPDCFAPASSVRPSSSAAVYEAARHGVSVISLHTNLDRSKEARQALPALMGLSAFSSLEHVTEPDVPGLGAVCEIEQTFLGDFASTAQSVFDTSAHVWGDAASSVCRVAFMGGSLGDFGEQALACNCDVVVTGELGYHRVQDLALRGLSVVLLGHDRSEQPFCRILADATANAGVAQDRIDIIPLPHQWWVPTQGGCA